MINNIIESLKKLIDNAIKKGLENGLDYLEFQPITKIYETKDSYIYVHELYFPKYRKEEDPDKDYVNIIIYPQIQTNLQNLN